MWNVEYDLPVGVYSSRETGVVSYAREKYKYVGYRPILNYYCYIWYVRCDGYLVLCIMRGVGYEPPVGLYYVYIV